MRVLSLGAGIQSTTVLLMSCRGELPRLDAAIFANTGWEPKAVYQHLAWLRREATMRHAIPVYEVAKGNLRTDALTAQVCGKKVDGVRWAALPYFVLGPNGERGMIRRQCTEEYKIRPIKRFIKRRLLGLKPRQRVPKDIVIEQWFGISVDERQRARVSTDKWVDFHYPLILDKKMTRQDCIAWLQRNYPDYTVPRSACIGCPYHTNNEWRNLRDNSPDEWQQAIEFDKQVRHCGGMRGEIYLHADRVPLDQVDLSTADDHGQIDMLSECTGMCGV